MSGDETQGSVDCAGLSQALQTEVQEEPRPCQNLGQLCCNPSPLPIQHVLFLPTGGSVILVKALQNGGAGGTAPLPPAWKLPDPAGATSRIIPGSQSAGGSCVRGLFLASSSQPVAGLLRGDAAR